MTRLSLLLAALLISATTSAEIYKWVDAQGEVHYQDHPRGTAEKFSTEEGSGQPKTRANDGQANTRKLIKAMEKSRKQREKTLHKKLAAQRKRDEKCIKLRDQVSKLEARMKKQYSEFSNDRPPAYERQQQRLAQRRQYLQKYCN